MKKAYTKKQIKEAIAYWEKQLKAGNYRKVNESLEYEGAEEDISSELEARDDIPNYLKPYIREQVLADVGHDGVGYHDWDLDQFAEDLKDEREILVTTRAGGPAINIPTAAVPLKVTPRQIEDYVNGRRQGGGILNVELRFDDYGAGSFCYSPDRLVAEDLEWCQETIEAGMTPMDMGPDGDATAICDRHGPLAINDDGTFG